MHPQTLQFLIDLEREKAYTMVLLREVQNLRLQVSILKNGFDEIESFASEKRFLPYIDVLLDVCKISSETVFRADLVASFPDYVHPNNSQSIDEVDSQIRDGCPDEDVRVRQ